MNSESVDLIYLDPPFNSKRTYAAPVGSKAAGTSFKDMWTWADVDEDLLENIVVEYPFLVQFIQSIGAIHSSAMKAYITYMTQRIVQLHRVLKSTGSFYIHVDPTASHYLKIILDRVFGSKNFRNEIIWYYDGPQRPSKKNFGSKHDIILRYSKSSEYFSSPGGIAPPNILSSEELKKYKKTKTGTYFYDLPRGDYTNESIKKLDAENRIRWTKNNKPRVIYYLKQDSNGNTIRSKQLHDVWSDIVSLGHAGGSEKSGYPTQKPLKLLERIIKASSNPGDVVLDPFAGCATTCVASQQLDRKWIGIDIEEKAADLVIERLSDDAGLFKDFVHRMDIPQRTDVKTEKPTLSVKTRLRKDQSGICKGCQTEYQEKDFEIDHIMPKSKGGGDYYDNYQVLCGSCNRIKGDRPMEYLTNRIRQINETKNRLSF